MGTLAEESKAYEPPTTLNIADLDEVPLDLNIMDGEGEDAEQNKFKYKYVVMNLKEYRVPNPVFEEIQKILKLKPDVKKVKIEKSGSGKATRYKVDAII